jgi:hypothetical protein
MLYYHDVEEIPAERQIVKERPPVQLGDLYALTRDSHINPAGAFWFQ